MHVMQQMLVKAKFFAYGGKQLWRKIEILLGRPQLLFRPLTFGCRFVGLALTFRHPVGGLHPRHAALHANRFKPHLFMTSVVVQDFIDGVTRGVAVNHHPFPRSPAQQLV